ncbi:hypothetical protein H6G76_08635 [Nostoc sp. FACHB-152]|uniref:hypothetical protein n=1 Tax=unclassified Nostoc TaxID=2593658 RepID=UPI001684230A|nr:MULTISPECIES: hypothetical protein [unclassified Nostoc]MBD2447231.1 hypothetical protein [Nostoc sp. FACHB-152]MBD2468168.1 hypothetical protein [Nostoc sp. FACHB-145]
MTESIPIRGRRGFEFSGIYPNSIGILLVKESIEVVSPAIAKVFGGVLETNVLGKEYPWSQERFKRIVLQYQGHAWTIIYPLGPCIEAEVCEVSNILKTHCIYIAHEDTSGWLIYKLFDQGKCIEEYGTGTDYTQEVLEIEPENLLELVLEKEAQGTPLASGWDPRQWDIYFVEGYSCYKFRSEEYTTTKEQLLDTFKFLDTLLRNQDAWLPDWDYLPWSEVLNAEKANADDFVRVDALHYYINLNQVSN